MDHDRLITVKELTSRVPNTTAQYWATRRYLGDGPTYVKLGRKVLYRESDVQAWIEENRRTRTDQRA